MERTTIVIVGAGLIGTSLAVALQKQGLRITILERDFPSVTLFAAKDRRPITLSLGSCQILKTVGVWDDLMEDASPVKNVHVSDRGALGALYFRANELKLPALGYVVPFFKLQEILYRKVANQENVSIIPINTINNIESTEESCVVSFSTLDGEKKLQSDVLVGADGAQSKVRELLNIATTEESKNETALIAFLELEKPHDFTAYERFTAEGTFAILPLLNRKRCYLVWSLPNLLANKMENQSDEVWRETIQNNFGPYLGNIKSLSRGKRYPLQMIVAKSQFKSNCILLGNAAHTLYPFAAQGFNLGLRDVAVLSELLMLAYLEERSLGDIRILHEYVRRRKSDQDYIIELVHGISGWFGLQLPLMKRLRGLGLLATELFPPLKKRLAMRVTGLAGRLPKLTRGLKLDDCDDNN